MHPTEDELRVLIDGEASAAETARLAAHLDQCGECRTRRGRIERADRETAALLETLDGSPPALSADDVIRVARGRRIAPGARARRGLLAASIAALLTGGIVVAALVPDSPVRRAVERLVGEPAAEEPEPAGEPAEAWSRETGVALVPGRELVIVFDAPQDAGSIELVTVAGDTARIEVRDDSVGFAVGPGTIRVANASARARYRISLPERLTEATIRIGDRTIYRK